MGMKCGLCGENAEEDVIFENSGICSACEISEHTLDDTKKLKAKLKKNMRALNYCKDKLRIAGVLSSDEWRHLKYILK